MPKFMLGQAFFGWEKPSEEKQSFYEQKPPLFAI